MDSLDSSRLPTSSIAVHPPSAPADPCPSDHHPSLKALIAQRRLSEPGRHHAHDARMALQHHAGGQGGRHTGKLGQETCCAAFRTNAIGMGREENSRELELFRKRCSSFYN